MTYQEWLEFLRQYQQENPVYNSSYTGPQIDSAVGQVIGNEVIKNSVQTLTDAQKTQARSNIGAYFKHADGIPASDMTAEVQASLERADDTYSALYYTRQGTSDNFLNSFIDSSGNFKNSTKTIVNGRQYNCGYDHIKSIKCPDGYSFTVYGYSTSFIYLGHLQEDGTFNPTSSSTKRCTEFDLQQYPNILFRFGLSHFVSGSAVDITPGEANVLVFTREYTSALANRSLSVIGDSISTFTGFTTPGAPAAYYPNNTAGLRVLGQMYWQSLAERNGMTIDVIDAYGGSTVGTKWDDNVNYTPFTDESRLSRLGNPDFIIVQGGINDFGGNPLGEYPADSNYNNMYEFRTSYAYLLNQLRIRYRAAKIVCLSMITPKTYNNTQYPEKQTEVKQSLSADKTPHYLYEFNAAIKELCARYGCIFCDIYDIANYYTNTTSALGPHPSAASHLYIANRIESALMDLGV